MGKRKSHRVYFPKKRTYKGNQFESLREPDARPEDVEESDVDATSDIPEPPSPADPSYLKLRRYSFLSTTDDDDESANDDHDVEADDTNDLYGNRIVSLSALQRLVEKSCVCDKCKRGKLTITEVERHGLAPHIQFSCNSCSIQSSEVLGEKQVHKKSRFYVNRKAVFAMRLIGRGRQALQTVCSTMDLPPPMVKSTFNNHRRAMHAAAKEIAQTSMRQAADTVAAKHTAEAKPVDIAVSTDGTWMRRGHSSLYGVQSVISYDTSQVLDVDLMSKHCSQCTSWKSRLDSGSLSQELYDAWKQEYADKCSINTTASSPAMEAEAVVKLWQHSEAKTNLRYTTYIGDGDSKGYSKVVDSKPYGETEIVKDECIGHVQKRLGKGFRDLGQKLGSQKLPDGKRLCGKGRLTERYMADSSGFTARRFGTTQTMWRVCTDLCGPLFATVLLLMPSQCTNTAPRGGNRGVDGSSSKQELILSTSTVMSCLRLCLTLFVHCIFVCPIVICCLDVFVVLPRILMSVSTGCCGSCAPRSHSAVHPLSKQLSTWPLVCLTTVRQPFLPSFVTCIVVSVRIRPVAPSNWTKIACTTLQGRPLTRRSKAERDDELSGRDSLILPLRRKV